MASAAHGRGCFLAAPAKESLCHLLRCIDRGRICDADSRHLSEQGGQDAAGVAMQLDRYWNSQREGGVILRAAASGNWEPVDASMRALQGTLYLQHLLTPPASLRRRVLDLQGWFKPSGLLVACWVRRAAARAKSFARSASARSARCRVCIRWSCDPG